MRRIGLVNPRIHRVYGVVSGEVRISAVAVAVTVTVTGAEMEARSMVALDNKVRQRAEFGGVAVDLLQAL